MIPRETADRIIDTARVEEVVGDYVSLRRRGASFVACCPFHNEKTPSFYVTPSKGIYKCFGCGKSGSAVGFVMEYEHCSYPEALRYLARKYHIEIQEEEESPEALAARQRKESLLLVSEFARKFYSDCLSTPEGTALGLAYLRRRGVEDSTIAAFGLGWAPSGRTALLDAAAAAGYKAEYLLDAGLAVRREDGSLVDKFRERVMFPIYSVSGRVVAFSGRTLHADNPAKYVNSPETEIYVKGRNLLGIFHAKSEISRSGKCILVEGNLDMVTLHQLGITNVVATCGTALTVEQIRQIHKFAENVTIMYDGDAAGIHAALRGIDLFLSEGLNVKVLLLPEGEDPDSFARKHTLAEMQDFIASGEKDFIAFKCDLMLEEAGSDPVKRSALVRDCADSVSLIPDAIKREMYVQMIASKFSIEESIISSHIARVLRKRRDDARREREREASRASAASPQEGGAPQAPYPDAPPPEGEFVFDKEPLQEGPGAPAPDENPTLAPVERDLLFFLLNYGTDRLEFETDSPYYIGSGEQCQTVADFIREALDEDECRFSNSRYRKLYDAYMEQYDAGADQESALRALVNSPDRQMADLAADFSTERYRLTVQSFVDSLTSRSTFIVKGVPKAVTVYLESRLNGRLDTLRHSLATAPEDSQIQIIEEIRRLQDLRQRVRKMIGR